MYVFTQYGVIRCHMNLSQDPYECIFLYKLGRLSYTQIHKAWTRRWTAYYSIERSGHTRPEATKAFLLPLALVGYRVSTHSLTVSAAELPTQNEKRTQKKVPLRIRKSNE